MPSHVVENSYYDHTEYGRVKVVSVTNGVVSFQRVNEPVRMANQNLLMGKKQSAGGFLDDTEPANVTVHADPAIFNILGKDPE